LCPVTHPEAVVALESSDLYLIVLRCSALHRVSDPVQFSKKSLMICPHGSFFLSSLFVGAAWLLNYKHLVFMSFVIVFFLLIPGVPKGKFSSAFFAAL